MEQQSLSVEARQTRGKGAARKLRAQGKVPAVLYGRGEAVSVTVDPRVVERLLLKEGGRNQIFNLAGASLEGKYAIVKDYQVDPVKRNLLHVDLLEIDVTKKLTVTVPINITGKSIGVAEGGVLNFIERTVVISCLPTNIPSHIDIDVTNLRIGDSLHMDEVKLPEGAEKAGQGNPTLLAVVPPAKEEDAAPSLAPTAEPEVITAKKEEGADAAKKDDKK